MAIDRDKVLQAAQKFVEKKKYDKAVLEYQKLIVADPSDTRTLLKIGDLQMKLGAYGDSIVTYERVAKLYGEQGFAVKAIAVYKQVRDIIVKHVPHLEDKYAHIVPRLADQQAAVKAKGMARLIKWWRAIERFEPGFHAAEKAEIEAALALDFPDYRTAWSAFRDAVAGDRIATDAAIILCNAHEVREAALMADAMGGLADTKFAPLQ